MDYAEKRKPIFKLRSNKNFVAECFNNILVSDSRVSWKLKPPKSSHFKTFSYFIFSLLILTTSKKKKPFKRILPVGWRKKPNSALINIYTIN
jgi:hypothetical protein